MVTVAIRSDGSVEAVTFVVSSGVAEIDEAIRRIVESQRPYPAFPPALGREVDIAFQSKFGRAKWLEPYTEPTLRELGAAGTARVDVMCPGFPADCLETLEEIAMEGREAFMHAGGEAFGYIPCLNDSPAWITALAGIAERNLAGWPTQRPAST